MKESRDGISQITNHVNLYQNYPNTFNPETTIKYSIPISSIVTLRIYDLTGQEIATLVNEPKNAGTHKVVFNAAALSSGIYFCQMQVDGFTQARKLLLAR